MKERKTMKKIVVFVLAALLLTGCTQTKTKGELKILTNSGYEPYEMVDKNGTLIGFDIELGNAIAAEMGYTVKWVDMDFDGIIAALNANQGDMSLAAFTALPGRGVDFSESYYIDSPYWVLTLASNKWSKPADLMNKTVGVQIGTVQSSAADLIANDYKLTKDARKDIGQMVQEIINKRIDWMLLDKSIADEYVISYPQMATFELKDAKFPAAPYKAVALPLGSKLTPEVNKAIAALKKNGKLDQLIAKWFTATK
jgi:polar amino acid transport system substrate-binding protein